MKKLILFLAMLCSPCFALGTWSHFGTGSWSEASAAATATKTDTGSFVSGDVLFFFIGCSTTGKADPTVSSSATATIAQVGTSKNVTGVGDLWIYSVKLTASKTNPTVTGTFISNCSFLDEGVEGFHDTATVASAATGFTSGSSASTTVSLSITGGSVNSVYIYGQMTNGSGAFSCPTGTAGATGSGTGNGFCYRLNLTGAQTVSGKDATATDVGALGAAWDESSGAAACKPTMSTLGVSSCG